MVMRIGSPLTDAWFGNPANADDPRQRMQAPCGRCGARRGEYCTTPSGYLATRMHKGRGTTPAENPAAVPLTR